MDERLKQLRVSMDELLLWKKNDERQPITLSNYGNRSQKTMQKDHLVFTGKTGTSSGVGDYSLEVKVGEDIFTIPATISP